MFAVRRILSILLTTGTVAASSMPALSDPIIFFRPQPSTIGTQAVPSFSLAEATLPAARVAQPWSHDLSSLAGPGKTTNFSAGAGFPAWATLSSAGVVTGTPPRPRGIASLPIIATRGGQTAERTYELRLRDPSVTFAAATTLSAKVGEAWSHDFAAAATGVDLGPDGLLFSSTDNPAWLTLGADGKAGGTPEASGPATFTVKATSVDAQGERTYTVEVEGVTIEVKQIAAGWGHTCALLTGGTVNCWGWGDKGQLGNGRTENITAPPTSTVANVSGATQIAGGSSHTCVLVAGGTVKCWGEGRTGQLGNGATGNILTPPTTTVANVADATQIVAGAYHTCVLVAGGTVKCWGEGRYGQLGNDGTANVTTPPITSIANVAGATQIVAGAYHTCALLAGGTVKCWGYNSHGQIGNGNTTDVRTPPTSTIANVAGATQIGGGAFHTCAIVTGGNIKCWGSGASGELGTGGKADVRTPPTSTIANVTGATQIATRGFHTCALVAGGTVKCWGEGQYGQLGNGGTSNILTPPMATVANVKDVTQIVAGGYHTCTLTSDSINCWGEGRYGQLGNGGTANVTTPPTTDVDLAGR